MLASATTFRKLFGTSNILDSTENRESNLLLDGDKGLTIEFWLKKNNLSGSSKQVIFDLWNSSSFGNDYGRFRVELHPGLSGEENQFFIEISSGSNGISNFAIGQNLNICNGNWQHYSLSKLDRKSTRLNSSH